MYLGWFDPMFLVIVGPFMVISALCSFWVKSAFSRWSQVEARNGMSGARIARAILAYNGINDVTVEEVGGFLSDHYDPTSKTLRLSPSNYSGHSVAALGIAAHEVGHAIQHAQAYAWLGFRSKLVPLAGIGSNLSWILIFMGSVAQGLSFLAVAGVVLFSFAVLFSIVTLPVEFDASRRALLALEGGQILRGEELDGARAVLRAAASTYVAAALTAIAQLVYFLIRSGLLGGRREE